MIMILPTYHVKLSAKSSRGTFCHTSSVIVLYLSPVRQHLPIPTISDQLVGKLGHGVIEIVADHEHDRPSLQRLCRIVSHRVGLDEEVGNEAVHVDVSILVELLLKFWLQDLVKMGWEVAEGVSDCKILIFIREWDLPDGSVRNGPIPHRAGRWEGN